MMVHDVEYYQLYDDAAAVCYDDDNDYYYNVMICSLSLFLSLSRVHVSSKSNCCSFKALSKAADYK